ncbi:hypothetical protein EO93_14690 [Methanosarcina sp. 1.H.A.2.2]|nr:hypothetical protein EO93_14690 [Methanosarcina sp. 1.H.A.2.2]
MNRIEPIMRFLLNICMGKGLILIFLIHNPLKKTSLEFEKLLKKGKESLNLRKPCKMTLIMQ